VIPVGRFTALFVEKRPTMTMRIVITVAIAATMQQKRWPIWATVMSTTSPAA
jgi:hypothetical protein